MLNKLALSFHKGANLRAQVLTLALPAVGEQVLNMMVGMANTYMVGHLGAAELTAVGLSNQVIMLISSFFTAVATATTALVARNIGADNRPRASAVLQQSVLLGLVIGLVTMILGLALPTHIMAWLKADAEVRPLGVSYLAIIAPSYLFMALLFIGNAALRGAGDTRTPLFIMAVVNVINVLITWLCMNGIGPLPTLGVESPALGAAIGRSIGGILVITLLLRGRGGLRIDLRRLFHIDRALLGNVLDIGLPNGGEQVIMQIGQISFATLVASLGTVAYAAHQVTITSQSASFMPGFGFSIAATTLVGQYLGRNDPEGAKAAARTAWQLAVAMMGTLGLFMAIFAPHVIRIFIQDPEVIRLGTPCLRILGLGQPLLTTMLIYSGSLRGAGDTRWPMFITGGSVWLVRLPLGRLLALTLGLGLTGIWLTMAADFAVRGTLFYLRFRSGGWQKKLKGANP